MPTDHSRVGSIVSTSASWFSGGNPTSPTQVAPLPTVHAIHGTPSSSKSQGSPNIPQSAALPGYRDALFGTMQQTLAWRDNTRNSDVAPVQQLPRLTGMGDRSGQLVESSREFQATSQNGNFRRMGQGQNQSQGFTSPPLLASDSTSSTTKSGSSTGTNQSPYYGPRTPMDVSLERSLPIPQTYSVKGYENQLPPLRSSMSPRASINVPYNSPHSKSP
jgi:hypothetical protein